MLKAIKVKKVNLLIISWETRTCERCEENVPETEICDTCYCCTACCAC